MRTLIQSGLLIAAFAAVLVAEDRLIKKGTAPALRWFVLAGMIGLLVLGFSLIRL